MMTTSEELDYLDWEPDDTDPCDHGDYEVDILDGRCHCLCGQRWHATKEQIEAEIERQAAYDDYLDEENRRQWWRDLFDPILSPFRALKRRFTRWMERRPPDTDDDIPF